MKNKFRRRIQIKIWPETQSYLPTVIPYERLNPNKANPIDFDFSNVSVVEAASLNLLLINLIKLTSSLQNIDWDIKFSEVENVNARLKEMKFFDIFPKIIPNNQLFWQTEILEKKLSSLNFKKDSTIESFPLYHLSLSKARERRDVVEEFKDWLFLNLSKLKEKYNFKIHKLILILIEIAKNSADHTLNDAFFGMDIIYFNNYLTFQFSLGDLGDGINQTVRRKLKGMDEYKNKDSHLALTDSYIWALVTGFTSQAHSKINRGIGIPTIVEVSRQIGLELSVFDAQSRGIFSRLDEVPTHTGLRKIFYSVGFNVGFYYYGTLKFKIQ